MPSENSPRGCILEQALKGNCLLLSVSWSRKKVGAASAQPPVRGISRSGHYSHLNINGISKTGNRNLHILSHLNFVASTDCFFSSTFLLMSSVSCLLVRNMTSRISYLKTSFFVGVELSFNWKLELFITMRVFNLMYRMCIKVIRDKNEASVDYVLFMVMEGNKYS